MLGQRATGSACRCNRALANGQSQQECEHVVDLDHAALTALHVHLNPDVQVIADVLAEYGDNIDAAIKHLTELRLGQVAHAVEAGSEQQAAQQQGEQPPQQGQQQTPAGVEGEEAQQQTQQTQQTRAQAQQQQQQLPGQAQQQQQRSAEEWVDLVVQQMGAAADLADAKRRASSVLQAFEQAALVHARGGEVEALRSQLAEALRENGLLKRAVAIQNVRMQELAVGGSGGGGSEVAQLRQALQEMSAKCHALEVQNYSLALHLRQATDARDPAAAAGTPHFKNPDVF